MEVISWLGPAPAKQYLGPTPTTREKEKERGVCLEKYIETLEGSGRNNKL